MNKIYNNDCFEVFKDIKDEIDLVCVDLPYGSTYLKWDVKSDLTEMWKELKKICKKNCVYVFFCDARLGAELIQSNPKWFRYDIVWEKTKPSGFLSCNKRPLRKHELIYVFHKSNGCYNPQKKKGEPYTVKNGDSDIKYEDFFYGERLKKFKKITNHTGERHPDSIIKCNNGGKKSKHKTEKPVPLLDWIIKSYSNEGDTVLDFTMGSGSCGVSALNLKRKFIGIEKDEEIFKMAEERLKKEVQKK